MSIIAHISIDVHIFAQEEQQERRRGIFHEKARHQFGFRFQQIEGRPVGFRQRRDEEDHQHRKQNRKGKPAMRFWARTMSDRFSEPANSSTVIITKPMETS